MAAVLARQDEETTAPCHRRVTELPAKLQACDFAQARPISRQQVTLQIGTAVVLKPSASVDLGTASGLHHRCSFKWSNR